MTYFRADIYGLGARDKLVATISRYAIMEQYDGDAGECDAALNNSWCVFQSGHINR